MRQGRIVDTIDCDISYKINTVHGAYKYFNDNNISLVLSIFALQGNVRYVLRPTIEEYENS